MIWDTDFVLPLGPSMLIRFRIINSFNKQANTALSRRVFLSQELLQNIRTTGGRTSGTVVCTMV